MNVFTTKRFDADYAKLPRGLRLAADRLLSLLAADPGHPSLRLKKMAGYEDVWEARMSRGHRITFEWAGDRVTLRRIGPHDVLRNP